MPYDKADILPASLWISYCKFSSLIWSSIAMILLYIYFKRFFLDLKGLSNGKVVSLTKKEYGSVVHSLYIFMKFLKPISDEWFSGISWSSLLFEIFMIKRWAEFNVTSFGTLNMTVLQKKVNF